MTPDGATVVGGSVDRAVRVWDARTGTICATLHGHAETVTALAVAADAATIVSVTADRTLKVWDGHKGLCLRDVGGTANRRRARRHTGRGILRLAIGM